MLVESLHNCNAKGIKVSSDKLSEDDQSRKKDDINATVEMKSIVSMLYMMIAGTMRGQQ